MADLGGDLIEASGTLLDPAVAGIGEVVAEQPQRQVVTPDGANRQAALARLATATTRRTAVVAKQDALVAAAATEVATAVAEAARVMGADAAAAVLDLSKAEVRRIVKEIK